MIQTRIIDSYTEIYGGGNWLTQSYPTNFHTFFKRKMLTKNEKIEDFKEVTEAEKTALEKADAAWERPPQSFIDMWKQKCHGRGAYNETTGFFELHGLCDISYSEAVKIDALSYSQQRINWNEAYKANSSSNTIAAILLCRTYYPISVCAYECSNFTNLFCNNKKVESISFIGGYPAYGGFGHMNLTKTFTGASNLKRVLFNGDSIQVSDDTFKGCTSLETLGNFDTWPSINNLNLADCPNFKVDTLEYAINKGKINTITLHPDVYGKVSDELFAKAADKNIAIASA